MKGKKNLLFIIDAQNDFVRANGRLAVPGAEVGLENLVSFIDENKKDITDIILTQDDHYPTHIGMAGAWRVNDKDLKPESYPFVITRQDVLDAKVMPKYLDFDSVVNYLTAVEKTGSVHCVWPDHCIKGSEGQAFPEELLAALKRWSMANDSCHYITIQKGSYDGAEMYSALSFADGSQPDYYREILNGIADEDYDNIFVAGFAKDYCVRSTLQDIMKHDCFAQKLVLLDDCMASINPNDEVTEEIWEELVQDFGARVWKKEDQ